MFTPKQQNTLFALWDHSWTERKRSHMRTVEATKLLVANRLWTEDLKSMITLLVDSTLHKNLSSETCCDHRWQMEPPWVMLVVHFPYADTQMQSAVDIGSLPNENMLRCLHLEKEIIIISQIHSFKTEMIQFSFVLHQMCSRHANVASKGFPAYYGLLFQLLIKAHWVKISFLHITSHQCDLVISISHTSSFPLPYISAKSHLYSLLPLATNVEQSAPNFKHNEKKNQKHRR